MVRYDFAGYDRDGRLRVLVEAKWRERTDASWAAAFRRNTLAHGAPSSADLFALVVPDKLYLWRGDAAPDAKPEAEVEVKALLAPYFDRAGTTPDRIGPMAFEQLIGWWLEDLARMSPTQGPDELKRAGLIDALAGGHVAHEAAA